MGQPLGVISCELTIVRIRGFEVTFNSDTSVVVKQIIVDGTKPYATSMLNVQTGELNVTELVDVFGAGANLQKTTDSRIKVTGGG